MSRMCSLLLLCLLLSVTCGFAEDSHLFGPHKIERGRGKPVSETHVFAASAGQPGKLLIENGDENGRARVSSLSVLVNGEEIVSPNRFNQNVGTVEEDLTLAASNTLSIKVNGEPGSFVLLSLLGSPGNGDETPTASLTVDPDLIQTGESAQLSWVTTSADTIRIQPDIGFVDVNGSISVAPDQTTTYLLTASGTSEVTSAVTLTVMEAPVPPAATLTVAPEVINPGESAVLSWTTQNAETVTIEPGIGNVAAAGSLAVSPPESTVYQLAATNGDMLAESNAGLQVLSPEPSVIQLDDYHNQQLDGALVTEPKLTISGTVVADLGAEIGVTVNGVVAHTSGQRFIANHVPLVVGWNELVVDAVNPQGETVSKTVDVYLEEVTGAVSLASDWLNGLAPLTTQLQVELMGGDMQNALVNCYGPRNIELLPDDQGAYPVTFDEPGLYTCIADVEDVDGRVFQDRIGLQVFDGTELDARLQQKWALMKNSLSATEIETAVRLFSLKSRDAFRTRFNAMGTALPEIVSRMGQFRMVTVRENSAIYDLRTTKDGREFSFQVEFIKDDDGIWRIWTF